MGTLTRLLEFAALAATETAILGQTRLTTCAVPVAMAHVPAGKVDLEFEAYIVIQKLICMFEIDAGVG